MGAAGDCVAVAVAPETGMGTSVSVAGGRVADATAVEVGGKVAAGVDVGGVPIVMLTGAQALRTASAHSERTSTMAFLGRTDFIYILLTWVNLGRECIIDNRLGQSPPSAIVHSFTFQSVRHFKQPDP